MQSRVVIVGGGVMGAATACFLARDHDVSVTVIERDPMYLRASSSLSASSIRQQFSQPVNIALSRWSLDFLRRAGDELATGDHQPQISLVEPGYLYLATAAGEAALLQRHALACAQGADIVLLEPAALHSQFPWLAVDDLALASWGRQGEGWFDGPALAAAFRQKAKHCGARFVQGQVVGFASQNGTVTAAISAERQSFAADVFVLCAGAWSGELCALLGVDLPVVPKKRDVFVFDSPGRCPDSPLVIDPSGLWFRPEGSGYLCGAPPRGEDPSEPPLHAIDNELFEEVLWPALARRVPEFEALRLRSAWAGYYDMNLFDHNGLAGLLPGWQNAYTACGFSGHGMQQAPAVGCAMAARISHDLRPGKLQQPELVRTLQALDPGRIGSQRPLLEDAVI